MDMMRMFPKLMRLFELSKPYLEKNKLGISHTERVLEIARKYQNIPSELEELVNATIILHDIGGRTTKDQYEKGPTIAAEFLKNLSYDEQFIKEICDIIRSHHERFENPSLPFKILYDSDQLVKFSKEEFQHYNSYKDFDWNGIIENLYFKHSKILAFEMWKKKQ